MYSNQKGLLSVYSHSTTNRGWVGWLLSALLISFYLIFYFTEWPTPVAALLQLGNKWTLYGLLYSIAILVGGIYFLRKHGNNRYHRYRTYTIIIVQLIFGFSIPYVMQLFNQHEYYFSYFWPLKIEYFYPDTILKQPLPLVLYSFIGSLIVFPLLGFILGKRFYCSWICGCGGLANTFGDPWRHLSSKSLASWKFEQVSIYSVLFLALTATVIVCVNWAVGESYPLFSHYAFKLQSFYGFWIGAIWAGVIGVGLYPLMGTRVWCRFGCPMAAILGLIQKFGRFRITVKDNMCIACGNCSAHCEMGIDVRSYAMNNQDFKRAACVGCGMCAHVCPRGVLKLENKWDTDPLSRLPGYSVKNL